MRTLSSYPRKRFWVLNPSHYPNSSLKCSAINFDLLPKRYRIIWFANYKLSLIHGECAYANKQKASNDDRYLARLEAVGWARRCINGGVDNFCKQLWSDRKVVMGVCVNICTCGVYMDVLTRTKKRAVWIEKRGSIVQIFTLGVWGGNRKHLPSNWLSVNKLQVLSGYGRDAVNATCWVLMHVVLDTTWYLGSIF